MGYMDKQFFQGTPIVSGTIRGRAKTIRDWAKTVSIDTGAVLVVRFPVPIVSSMLNRASALLCAYGSTDSYLANVAREYGIPAVFKLGPSLESVSDGEWVSVDGATGRVFCEQNPATAEITKDRQSLALPPSM